jgi:hypothetical protein
MRLACEKILVFQEKKTTCNLQVDAQDNGLKEKDQVCKEESSIHSSETTDVLQEDATTDSVEKVIYNKESFDYNKERHDSLNDLNEIAETNTLNRLADEQCTKQDLQELPAHTKVSRVSEVLDSLSDSLESKNKCEQSEQDSEEDHVVCQWNIQPAKCKPIRETINETNQTFSLKNYYAPSNHQNNIVQMNEQYNEKGAREQDDMSQSNYRKQKCLNIIPQAIIVLDNEKTLTYDILGNGKNSMESKNTFVSMKKEPEAAHVPFMETIPFDSKIITPSQCMFYAESYENTQKRQVVPYESDNEINEHRTAPSMTIPQGYPVASSVVSGIERYPSYKAQHELECDTTQMIQNETLHYSNLYNKNFLCNGKGVVNKMSSPTNESDGVDNGVNTNKAQFVKTTPCQYYGGNLPTCNQANEQMYASVTSLAYQENQESSPYRHRQMNPLERSYNAPSVFVQNTWNGRSGPLEASPETFHNNAFDPSSFYEQPPNGMPKHVLEAKYYTHMYAYQNNKETLVQTVGDSMQSRTNNVVLVNGCPNGNQAENNITSLNERNNQQYLANDFVGIENMRKVPASSLKYDPNRFPPMPNYEYLAQQGPPKESGFLRRRVQQRHAKDTTTPKGGFWGSRFDYIKRTFALC